MIRYFLNILFFLTITAVPACLAHAEQGDVNSDQQVDLADLILALQISAGMSPNPATIHLSADVDGDQKIGMAEVIYAANFFITAKEITAYSLLGVSSTIEGAAISITLPYGTNLTSLVATFSTTGASVRVGNTIQTSGATANNFTSPVIYTVTAADGSTRKYTVSATTAPATSPTIAGCQIFPATAIFNSRIDDTAHFPVHASNTAWKAAIDSTGPRRLHLDWGTTEDQNQHDTYWGIPYNVVDGSSVTTNWPIMTYDNGWADESDCAVANGSGGYSLQRDCSAVSKPRLPIPTDATVKVEGGYCPIEQSCPDGDHHILVVEKATCRLWEAYYAAGAGGQSANGSWDLYGSAAWDLNSLEQRPEPWTSGDAAGLPILPLLVRVDEANAGEIKHALRVTLRSGVMAKSYVWPAGTAQYPLAP
jgi:hypothetical protein